MYNIFAPFVLTLTFFNYGARWMGETFLPLYFYNTERIFIPPLQSSVSFSKVSPYAQMMTYPELDLDQELSYSALVFAQNVPDFKTCFPEVRLCILHLGNWGSPPSYSCLLLFRSGMISQMCVLVTQHSSVNINILSWRSVFSTVYIIGHWDLKRLILSLLTR